METKERGMESDCVVVFAAEDCWGVLEERREGAEVDEASAGGVEEGA